MKQILIIFFLMTSPFMLGGLAQANEKEAEPVLPQGDFSDLRLTGNGTVGQIIDPMTVRLNDGRIITLTGLDFPDYGIHRMGPLGETAIKIMNDMLVGKDVSIYQTKNQDWGRVNRMEREIAHLERKSDFAWVQGTLISLGLAQVMTSQRNPEMAAQMYKLEEQAQKDKIGIWEKDDAIRTPDNLMDSIESFRIVEGIVRGVALNKNRIYLNFGDSWKDDFTVSVAPGDKRLFQSVGIDLMKLQGKAVRVRGWVRSYNGPYMEIDHPEALQVINAADLKASPLKQETESSKVKLRQIR